MDLIFTPIRFFLMHPERVALVAGIFLVASLCLSALQRRAGPMLITSVGWALLALWEWYCAENRYNIRIDLAVIVPLIFSLTLWGLLSPFLSKSKRAADE